MDAQQPSMHLAAASHAIRAAATIARDALRPGNSTLTLIGRED
jgi:hypothetical protein